MNQREYERDDQADSHHPHGSHPAALGSLFPRWKRDQQHRDHAQEDEGHRSQGPEIT